MEYKSLPSEDEAENLNELDSQLYIKNLCNLLQQINNIENDEILHNLTQRLSSIFFDYRPFREKVCEVLINVKSGEITNKIFLYLMNKNKFEIDSMDKILNFLINFTDFSVDFSSHILGNIFQSFVNFCIKNPNRKSFNDSSKSTCMLNCITVINNVIRYRDNILQYNADQFKQTMVKYINFNNSDDLGIMSMLTLSYIIEETEINLLEEASNVIGFLIDKIKMIKEPNKTYGGFSMKELLNGLRCISVNDSMKEKIYKEGGISLLINILNSKFTIEDEALALEIIHNLSFNKTLEEILRNEYQIENIIENFASHKDTKIKMHYDGIKWLLTNKQMCKKVKLKDANFKFDVFLSYCRENKSIISDIRNQILESNYRVWIDDEQMIGSTIEAMANGIERSRIVIIAMCKSYKESPNCRHEAEYAFTLKKPIVPVILQLKYKPDSWLGFIVGSKMYYEFSERRDKNESMRGIIKSIGSISSGNTDLLDEINENVDDIEIKELYRRIEIMTAKKVSQWLVESKLGHFQKNFSEIDGTLLVILINIRKKSPEYFNRTLKDEYKMKFIEVLKFHKALDSLLK